MSNLIFTFSFYDKNMFLLILMSLLTVMSSWLPLRKKTKA